MKRILVLLSCIGIIVCCYFIYYNQTVTEYYRVSIYPPTSYDSRPKVEIVQAPQYENDSLAIEAEEHIFYFMQERWEKVRKESMKKNHTNDDVVYRRFRDEHRILIKIVHNRSFEVGRLQEVVVEHGLYSCDVEKFCKDNDVDISIYAISSKY